MNYPAFSSFLDHFHIKQKEDLFKILESHQRNKFDQAVQQKIQQFSQNIRDELQLTKTEPPPTTTVEIEICPSRDNNFVEVSEVCAYNPSVDKFSHISDMNDETLPVAETIPTSSAASSVSTPFWAKPFGLASSVIDISLVGTKILSNGVASLARELCGKVLGITSETASSSVKVVSYPAQDALMLLQIPAIKIGQYRNRERSLSAAEQRELKEYHQRLIELQQQLEPHQTALVKSYPEFASESQHLLKVLQSELIPAVRSGRGSNLLLERVERLMGYLEKRAKAIEQWISSMSNQEKPWIELEGDESDEFFTEQLPSRPESYVSQLTSGIGLWHIPRSVAVIDSKPVNTTKFQLGT